MAAINFDTANTGYGGNYGGGGYGGYYGGGFGGGGFVEGLLIGTIFDGGFGRGRGRDGDKNCACCAPATCEQVNDVDRDVLKTGFDVTEAVHDEGRTVDRDVLMTANQTQGDICKSTHLLEKEIGCVDKDVLLGFCDTNRHIDRVETQLATGIAEIKCQIKETALCQENKELMMKVEKLQDKINKKDTVAEILAALGVTPVIANASASN